MNIKERIKRTARGLHALWKISTPLLKHPLLLLVLIYHWVRYDLLSSDDENDTATCDHCDCGRNQ